MVEGECLKFRTSMFVCRVPCILGEYRLVYFERILMREKRPDCDRSHRYDGCRKISGLSKLIDEPGLGERGCAMHTAQPD